MSYLDTVKRLPEVYKAVVAGVTAVLAQEGTLLAVLSSSGFVPENWVHAVVLGFGGLAGFLTWAKANEASVETIDKIVSENFELVEELIAGYKAY